MNFTVLAGKFRTESNTTFYIVNIRAAADSYASAARAGYIFINLAQGFYKLRVCGCLVRFNTRKIGKLHVFCGESFFKSCFYSFNRTTERKTYVKLACESAF